MKLAVVSHKVCWENGGEFYTDGGFPRQMKAISELFDETVLVVPCRKLTEETGLSKLSGKNSKVAPLSVPGGANLTRKLLFPLWLAQNGWRIFREISRADAVHAPIPGDVGTIGMIFALILQKPLFVRYCGNWLAQKTRAEKIWRRLMEKFGGGKNVMMATGGGDFAPSAENPAIEWIFSTSLTDREIKSNVSRRFPAGGKWRLITACRLEPNKGVETVIESFPLILREFPQATLEIIGGGALLESLKTRAEKLGLAEKITFHGKVKHEKVGELLKRAHVFCYPTISEGFPKAVLEALAAGLPVITTKVSVLPKLIENGSGILLDCSDAKNLAEAIKTLGSDAAIYEEMSRRAMAAAGDYSLENWRETIGAALRKNWRVAALSSGCEAENPAGAFEYVK